MQKMNFSKWMFGLGLTATLACTHTPPVTESPRAPASSTATGHTELSPEQIAIVQQTIANKTSLRIERQLLSLQRSQIWVSSFDQHLASLKTGAEVDALLASNLYCKLQMNRSRFEETEAEMVLSAKTAYQTSTDTKTWFYGELKNFAKGDASKQAAVVGLVRELVQHDTEICGSPGCLNSDITTIGLRIDPMDDAAFSQFIKTNRAFISKKSDAKALEFKPGNCQAVSNRQPSQASTFDWKNRNWVGSVLPAGQFVFTYDDGPHGTYTRQIRDTWAQGGMVKPSFFWLSKNVQALPDIVKELNSQGYVISSHSERHADLGNLAKANSASDFNGVNKSMFTSELQNVGDFEAWKNKTLDREIIKSVETISKVTGKPVYYFRLPYGSGTKSELIGSRFQAIDVDHFYWRVDSLDWQDKNPESIRDRVVAQMKATKSGIVLFHDVHPQSAAAAKLMVQFLQQNPSFQAVTIESLPGLKVRK